MLSDSKSIADCLNTHFGSVGEKMASKIDQGNSKIKDPLEYVPKKVEQSVFLPYTDINKVMQLLSSLDINKGCGYCGMMIHHRYDLISNRILKRTCDIIAPYIVYLFNLCLMQGVFPDAFKVAKVIPLFKGGGGYKRKSRLLPTNISPTRHWKDF